MEKYDEFGWIIERYIHSELHYWNCDGTGFPWSKDSLSAIRFAREVDAQVMLTRLCDGVGRVTQHAWVESAPLELSPPDWAIKQAEAIIDAEEKE